MDTHSCNYINSMGELEDTMRKYAPPLRYVRILITYSTYEQFHLPVLFVVKKPFFVLVFVLFQSICE